MSTRLDKTLASHGVYDGKTSLYFQPEVDEFKEAIKALMLELITEVQSEGGLSNGAKTSFLKKVEEL